MKKDFSKTMFAIDTYLQLSSVLPCLLSIYTYSVSEKASLYQ